MNDLLGFALDAHGGHARWNEFTKLSAEVSIGGAIWDVKQQPGLLNDKVLEIRTQEQRLTISPFSAPSLRCVFVPGRLVIEMHGACRCRHGIADRTRRPGQREAMAKNPATLFATVDRRGIAAEHVPAEAGVKKIVAYQFT